MSGFATDKLNALRLGRVLVTEVPASEPTRRSWVAIYPGAETRAAGEDSREGRTFRVFHREFSRQHIMEDRWCGPGDGMWDLRSTRVEGEAALMELLRNWGVDVALIEYVHRSDYPV